MTKEKSKEWFEMWFNSPYYHILYKNRNYEEAARFIDNLCNKLQIKPHHTVLDIACGKGRHAIHLNTKGFDVTGIDISPENIAYATTFENEHLRFFIQDMRKVFIENQFDFAFNLFTSFGYFEKYEENEQAIIASAQNLKESGFFVLDFMNTHKVIKDLLPYEEKQIDGIHFHIKKSIENGMIVKDITFEIDEKTFSFQEKVKVISQEDFERMFANANLKICFLYGDYELNPFDKETSDRKIFIAQK